MCPGSAGVRTIMRALKLIPIIPFIFASGSLFECFAQQGATEYFAGGDSSLVSEIRLDVNARVLIGSGEAFLTAPLAEIPIRSAGYYRIYAKVNYNSGDQQKNESFFLTAQGASGKLLVPDDANAGAYKVVPDAPGPARIIWRDAGYYPIPAGNLTLTMHHYFRVASTYPQFMSGSFSDHESVGIDSLRIVYAPSVDGVVSLVLLPPRKEKFKNAYFGVVYPGELFAGTIRVANRLADSLRSARLELMLPDSCALYQTMPQPEKIWHGRAQWLLPPIARMDTFAVTFTARLAGTMPAGYMPLDVHARLLAPFDADSRNNVATARIFSFADSSGARPAFADLSVSMQTFTDSTVMLAGKAVVAAAPGEEIRHRFTVYNIGPDTARQVKLTAAWPGLFQPSSVHPPGRAISAEAAEWSFDALSPFAEVAVEFRARMPQSMPRDTLLTTSVFVESANDWQPRNNHAADSLLLLAAPQLDVALQLNAVRQPADWDDHRISTVEPADTFYYYLQVMNPSTVVAHDLRILASFPTETSILESMPPFARSAAGALWRLQELKPGEIRAIATKAAVANEFPSLPAELVAVAELAAPGDVYLDNNRAKARLIVQPPAVPDIAVSVIARTDTAFAVNGDTMRFAQPGETFSYSIHLRNQGAAPALGVELVDILSPFVRILSAEPASLLPANQDSLSWHFERISAGEEIRVQLQVVPDVAKIDGLVALVSRAHAEAANEPHALSANNSAADTVYYFAGTSLAAQPRLRAYPESVETGAPVSLEILLPFQPQSLALRAYYADGNIDSTFAQDALEAAAIAVNQWYVLPEVFKGTRLVTGAKQEQIIFELTTRDPLGLLRKSHALVTVRSSNALALDRNVFRPGEQMLGIRFKLSSNRRARLELYDLTGRRLGTIVEDRFYAGWNSFSWSGAAIEGRELESGVYLVAIRSGEFTDWRKIIVVR